MPAYSAATREWALAATSASSATTSCFWDRLRAILHSLCYAGIPDSPSSIRGRLMPCESPIPNFPFRHLVSARSSCRLRPWTAPSLTLGMPSIPLVAPEEHSRRHPHLRRPVAHLVRLARTFVSIPAVTPSWRRFGETCGL